MIDFETGVYKHYKGGLYLAVSLAETHEHNGDLDVVYISSTTGKTVTRPLQQDSRKQDSWTDEVLWPDGHLRHRFIYSPESGPEFLKALEESKRGNLKLVR